MNPARRRQEDPIREAALLVRGEPWNSTRARLFEGAAASVLMTSRRDGPGISDVSVTLMAAERSDEGGAVIVTLKGATTCIGRLDARGCCVIRGVPDDEYLIDIRRERDHPSCATILRLPA